MKESSYILHRNELDQAFDKMLQYPVTLVVAPMGYGKSTAVLSYLGKLSTPWIMISFDSLVTTPAQVWNHLASQIEKDIPLLGRQLYNLGYPTDFAQFENVIDIFEEHCSESELVLVIDDFHNVQSPEFNNLLQQITMRKVAGLHFLIISRRIPKLRLEELILKNCCYLIDSTAFELTPEQIYSYFAMYNITLSNHEIEQISQISEGWISAVSLLQRRYVQTGQISKEIGIESMLAASYELLFSVSELQVLMKLALLDNFTLPLAIYLINDSQIEQVLMRMCYHNLFIRFDTHSGTYRMHNILRDFLINRLNRTTPLFDEASIYKMVGNWYIEKNETIPALIYFLKSGDFSSVLCEFEKPEMTEYYDRIPSVIVDIFNQIPLEERYKNPIAYLSYIGFYVTNIEVTPGFRMLTDAESHFNLTITDFDQLNRINGEIELIRTYVNFNELTHMRINLSKAHSMLKGRSLIANPQKIPSFGSPQTLYLYYRSSMSITDTFEQMSLTYPYYYALSGGCGDGFIHQAHSEVYLETGDFENAERYAKKAIYSMQGAEQLSVTICSNFTLSRSYIAQGNPDRGLAQLEHQRDTVWNCGPPMLIHCYELATAYIDCILDSSENLPKWISSGDLSESNILYQGMGFGYIVYGKYLLISHDYLRLEVLCERMQKVYSQFNNQIGFLHMFLLQAFARYHLYGLANATESLVTALTIGKKNQIVLLFAEYGDDLIQLLNTYTKSTQASDEYIDALIQLAGNYKSSANTIESSNPVNLTDRELATLKLVCNGKTNREISEILSIAEITVRKNLTSIYRKLNVANRASAIRKYLNIIS